MIVFSAYSHKKRHGNLFVFLLSIGMTGFAGWLVLTLVQNSLPAGLRDKNPELVCLAVAIFFDVLAVVVYFKTRSKIEAVYRQDIFSLTVFDPALDAPLRVSSPCRLVMEWTQVPGAKPGTVLLYITVCNPRNEPLVSFAGRTQRVPEGFEYFDMSEGSPHARAEYIYDLGRMCELAGVMSRYAGVREK